MWSLVIRGRLPGCEQLNFRHTAEFIPIPTIWQLRYRLLIAWKFAYVCACVSLCLFRLRSTRIYSVSFILVRVVFDLRTLEPSIHITASASLLSRHTLSITKVFFITSREYFKFISMLVKVSASRITYAVFPPPTTLLAPCRDAVDGQVSSYIHTLTHTYI